MRKALWFLLSLLSLGCAGGLKMTTTVARVRQPANVLVLFRVEGPDGPVRDLAPSSFRVKENDVVVSANDDLRVVRPDLTENLRLLVLLDFGGHISDFEREALISSAKTLIMTLRNHAKTAVYVFDGADTPEVVVIAKDDEGEIDKALARLRTRKSRDTSTDVHSALVSAAKTLQLESDPPKPHTGMLLLLSRGPDRAGRTSREQVDDQLDASDMEVVRFVVAVGSADPFAWLSDDVTAVESASDLDGAVGRVAQRIDAIARSYYLLSFCSGARAGETKVTIEAERSVTDGDGQPRTQRGTLTETVSAEGFGPNCTPWTPATSDGR